MCVPVMMKNDEKNEKMMKTKTRKTKLFMLVLR